MDEFVLARVLHVLGVVLWIGGVAMVTTVLLPAVAKMKSAEERVDFFEHIESRFAAQARFTTLLVGLSGFYMMYILDGWNRFAEFHSWWMHAMVLVWAIFTLMLFVLEPWVLHKWFKARAQSKPEKTFALILRLHWFLLSISVITVAGAVAGSHGWFFLEKW
ncbi:hypothetical protein [Nitrosomonas sp. Nm132]|jgi:uncharacterized membrane protein|uniref:hypothetical protein n=1 Tax=Nitrosomonas sp. Nm132 TaxID=1881053 RepID=UPI00088D604C|nr:hypothetical protein [Nitrosomonas sp. Nm132]SDI00424.1 Uncharacterized membrane protein [Nitrosomonas sp. Nm132]